MDIVVVSLASFFIAILTFFSGFGLGTLLTPIFMLYFPVELAIALTGMVHFFNNIFKVFLVGKYVHKEVFLKFGIPAILFAFIGSLLLININNTDPIFSFELFDKTRHVFLTKLMVSVLLFFFALIDLIPGVKKLEFNKNKLPLGGAISGFFGGLSGNQGALRTAFLIKSGLPKEMFIGTSVVISTFVDITRLSVYTTNFKVSMFYTNYQIILFATFFGILGSYLGNKLLKKITILTLQIWVAIFICIISIMLGFGII